MSLAGFTFRNKATSISDGPCCLIFVSTETAQLSFHCVRCVQCVRACCFADLVDSLALVAEYASRLEYDSDVWTLDVQTLQASRTGGFVEAHCANNRLRTSSSFMHLLFSKARLTRRPDSTGSVEDIYKIWPGVK